MKYYALVELHSPLDLPTFKGVKLKFLGAVRKSGYKITVKKVKNQLIWRGFVVDPSWVKNVIDGDISEYQL